MAHSICTIEDCSKAVLARGWCSAHYDRWLRTGDPLGSSRPTVADRFWRKVEKTDTCWIWTGSVSPKGYGRLNVKGKVQLAHRVSYGLHHGEPGGLVVCHRCDNPPCVNPAHLFIGTKADNTADMMAKGRGVQPSGDCNGMSKITEAQAVELRALRSDGWLLREIADRYGLHASHVSRICSGTRR